MKILAIHNFHRPGSASGDDQVFISETNLLRRHGHEVITYCVRNDEFDNAGPLGKIARTAGMMWSWRHYFGVYRLVKKEKPDIVHVHTFFPLMSPSILYAAKRAGAKVVATLHDTRFVCPVATSLRNGALCNKCGDGCYLRMVRHACFKGSRLQSVWVAAVFSFHRMLGSFYKQIDRYICLNDEQIRLLVGSGFNSSRISKKYNFVEDPTDMIGEVPEELPERYVVYYGRIGEEKGIRIFMKAWDQLEDIPFVVMGGGPLEDEFRVWAKDKPNVHYLGYTPRDKCLAVVERAEFVVFPSIWYEGCSMVEIESESLGKPIVATNLGFSAEAIENGYNGLKFALGSIAEFARAVRELWNKADVVDIMGSNARRDYLSKYTASQNIDALIEIYRATYGPSEVDL